jgi:hypothetical protein
MKPLPFKRVRVEFPRLLSSEDSPFSYPRIVVAEHGSCLVCSEAGVVHRLFDRIEAPAMTVFLQDYDDVYRIGELLEPVSFSGYSHVFSNEHHDLMLVSLDGSLRVEVLWLDELFCNQTVSADCVRDVEDGHSPNEHSPKPLSSVPMVVFPSDDPPDTDSIRFLRSLVKTVPLKRGSSLYRGNGLVVIKAPDVESYIADSGLAVLRPIPKGELGNLPSLVEMEQFRLDSHMVARLVDNRWIVSEPSDQSDRSYHTECRVQVSRSLSDGASPFYSVDPKQLGEAMLRIAKRHEGRFYGLVDPEYSQDGATFYTSLYAYRKYPYWTLSLFTLLVWFRFKNRMHIATPLITQNLRILKLWLPRRQDEDQA